MIRDRVGSCNKTPPNDSFKTGFMDAIIIDRRRL